MRKLALMAAAFLALAPICGLFASSDKYLKVGDFDIVSLCKNHGFLLDDGNVYTPTSHHQEQNTLDWQKGDSILVLKNENKSRRFLCINTRTTEKVKMKVSSVGHCSSD